METMKAAVLEEFFKPLVLKEVALPVPGPGEVRIRVRATGLCASDLHIQEGMIKTVTLPHILGHEVAGVVESLGDGVTNLAVGAHVVVGIDITCKTCDYCRTGRGNLCKSLTRVGFERDGGYAPYLVVPRDSVYEIDPKVPFEQAAVIPDAVACMYHAIKTQAKLFPGSRVCILGMGGLGFQGIQIAKLFGAKVYCTSRQDPKLELAREFGADGVINTKTQDLVEEIYKLTDGEMCDVVFDNIGIEDSIMQSLNCCKPGGKAIIVGYSTPTFTVEYQDIMKLEKEIIGMRGSTGQDLVESIRFVEEGAITPFIYKTYPFTEVNEALQDLAEGKSMGRTVITFD